MKTTNARRSLALVNTKSFDCSQTCAKLTISFAPYAHDILSPAALGTANVATVHLVTVI